MNQYYLRVSQITVLLFSLIAVTLYFDPFLLILSLFLGWFFQGYALELIIHRKYAHNQFQYKNKFFEFFSYFCLVASSLGRPFEWSYGHRVHHRYTDQSKDPQSPHSRGKLNTLFSIFPRNVEGWEGIVDDLLKDKRLMFFNHYYYILLLAYYAAFFYFDIVLALYFIGIPSVLSWASLGYVNTFAHSTKYKPTNLKAPWFFWGANYHRNHHSDPRQKKLGNLDISFYAMRIIGDLN